MCVGWSGLLFRTQHAGMVNITNRRLWSQPCWKMLLMTQWCLNTKEWPLTHTHLLLYLAVHQQYISRNPYTHTRFYSPLFLLNLSFQLLTSSVSTFLFILTRSHSSSKPFDTDSFSSYCGPSWRKTFLHPIRESFSCLWLTSADNSISMKQWGESVRHQRFRKWSKPACHLLQVDTHDI